MKKKIRKYNLEIDGAFFDFINNEVLPGTQINKDVFWNGFSKIIYDFEPINQQLIKKRNIIQQQLDTWHRKRLGKDYNLDFSWPDFPKWKNIFQQYCFCSRPKTKNEN